jgi:hypothetical protein
LLVDDSTSISGRVEADARADHETHRPQHPAVLPPQGRV